MHSSEHNSDTHGVYDNYVATIGVPSDEALRSGLTDLRKVSSTISDAYRKELKAFNRKRKN